MLGSIPAGVTHTIYRGVSYSGSTVGSEPIGKGSTPFIPVFAVLAQVNNPRRAKSTNLILLYKQLCVL